MTQKKKTERILSIFHLLRYCNEVSFKEVTDYCGAVSRKTVYRDICLLRQLGLQIEFKKNLKAYVLLQERKPPHFPKNQTQQLYRKKILRLIDMMLNMDRADDPVAWYCENYPGLNVRTMQRDFKILGPIGYEVRYMRGVDERGEHPPNKYYCEWPYGVY